MESSYNYVHNLQILSCMPVVWSKCRPIHLFYQVAAEDLVGRFVLSQLPQLLKTLPFFWGTNELMYSITMHWLSPINSSQQLTLISSLT